MQGLLPLFPLPLVLLPAMPLPLHIFEPRYKEMIGEALERGTEFGVVLAREKGILNTGCTAAIDNVLKKYPDGRLDILTSGRRRFEVLSLDQEQAYLRGAVEYFEDEDPSEIAPDELVGRAREAYRLLAEIEPEAEAEPSAGPQLSFRLAQVIEDLDFRQRLLATRSETERLKDMVSFCERYIPRRRTIASLKRVQALNGHGRFPFPPGTL